MFRASIFEKGFLLFSTKWAPCRTLNFFRRGEKNSFVKVDFRYVGIRFKSGVGQTFCDANLYLQKLLKG